MTADDDGVDWDALYDNMRRNGLDGGYAAEQIRQEPDPESEDSDEWSGWSAPREENEARTRIPDLPFAGAMFSTFAITIPERKEGERPATVRGMVWRTVLLFAWYVGVYLVNVWYYLTGHGEYDHMDLAVLSWFGVRFHSTWLGSWGGPLTTLAVFVFSLLTMVNVGILMVIATPKHKYRLLCLLIVLLMPVAVDGFFTEDVLQYVDYGADFPDRYPNTVPGLIMSVVCIALVSGSVFWSVLQDRKGDRSKSRLARHLAMLSPVILLLGILACEGLSGLVGAIEDLVPVLLLAALFVPSELDGARWIIEHDRGAYWLWPAATAAVSEFFLCVFGLVSGVYGL
mgnify:CR=1 FL=1